MESQTCADPREMSRTALTDSLPNFSSPSTSVGRFVCVCFDLARQQTVEVEDLSPSGLLLMRVFFHEIIAAGDDASFMEVRSGFRVFPRARRRRRYFREYCFHLVAYPTRRRVHSWCNQSPSLKTHEDQICNCFLHKTDQCRLLNRVATC